MNRFRNSDLKITTNLNTTSPYHPFFLLKNGHFNTIFSSLWRAGRPQPFQRKRISTYDGDFIDIDFLKNKNKRIAILLHGLEGSSQSGYILRHSELLHENGWDIAAINYRGCSGELNLKERVYHSGSTEDIRCLIDSVIDQYDELAIIGFSLGGSFTLRYLGEMGKNISPKIKKAVAVSVPFDMPNCVHHLDTQWDNILYRERFLVSLKSTARLKAAQYPETFTDEKIDAIKTLFDFDNTFTGPINGFKGAADYHEFASCKHLIPDIHFPVLVINALDDPFLPDPDYPTDIPVNPFIQMLTPKYGGHVGFGYFTGRYNWVEMVVGRYLNIE